MKLKIEIVMDNAAFEYASGTESARILRKLANRIEFEHGGHETKYPKSYWFKRGAIGGFQWNSFRHGLHNFSKRINDVSDPNCGKYSAMSANDWDVEYGNLEDMIKLGETR